MGLETRGGRAVLVGSWGLLLAQPAALYLGMEGRLPPGLGVFPPQRHPGVPGFRWEVALVFAAVAGAYLTFLIVPRWFGFQGSPPPPRAARAGLPPWFWPGVVVGLVSWGVMWGQFPALGALRAYTFVPLWWGYIAALDGWVYARTGGHSPFTRGPVWLALVAASSSVGWFYFEYLDAFVASNWYYPHADAMPWPQVAVWFALAYTTIQPAIFEWYALLRSLGGLSARYTRGPRWEPSRTGWWTLLGLGLLLNTALVVWPTAFFWALWLGPTLVLAAALGLAGRWTPLHALREGDWGGGVLMGLATLFNYVLGEMWNHWSAPANPNYWKYDVPFVGEPRLFEMPVLGFFGYLPFGLFCWLWWLHCAGVLGVDGALEPAQARSNPDSSDWSASSVARRSDEES